MRLKQAIRVADAKRVTLRARENAFWVLLGCAGTAAIAWLGLYGFAWNDYEAEALPAVHALAQGHLDAFFTSAPVYGGSLLERAPFALVPGLWGGGDLTVYRMLALPCLLGGLFLGLWIVGRIRSQGGGRLTQVVAFGLCVANPLTLATLELGHPEELLGGALCVAAVLLAARERPVWAGLALGAAVANKQWALLALGPVLLALPARRMLCVSVAGALAATLLAPFALSASSLTGATSEASAGSTIFTPLQLWWFFGHHGHVVHGLFGEVKPDYRTAPSWPGTVSHPLIIAVALPLTVGAWLSLRQSSIESATSLVKRGNTGSLCREHGALLLLALLLLLRCLLDTWDNIYYPLPFVLALGTWEALALQRVPALALTSVVIVWAACRWLPSFASADAQSAFFLAWSATLAVGLAVALYAPGKLVSLRHRTWNRHGDRRLVVLAANETSA